jgi:hypothetical protein
LGATTFTLLKGRLTQYNVAILPVSPQSYETTLQFAFPVLQFAIGAAIDCKLQSSNCKGQIIPVFGAEQRFVFR